MKKHGWTLRFRERGYIRFTLPTKPVSFGFHKHPKAGWSLSLKLIIINWL